MSNNKIVVGIIGKLNSGKNTVATVFQKEGFMPYAFADPIKEIIHDLFEIPREVLWGPSEERTGEVRRMLQLLGTEFGRAFRPDVWVNKLTERILGRNDDRIIITDVRFPNEARRIVNYFGGSLIKVERPTSGHHETDIANFHTSETSAEDINEPIDYFINNDGTLEELETAAENIVWKVLDAAVTR